MTKIIPVAINTFRETIRARGLVALPIYLVALPAVALAGGYVAVGLERKILVDVGLSLLTLIGLTLSIFWGTSLARVEIDRGGASFLLARPLHRAELILGRFAGLAAAQLVATVGLAAILTLFDLLIGSRGAEPGTTLALWPVIGLIFLELLIVLALALFFASFTNQLPAMILTLLLTLTGRSAPELNALAATVANPAARLLLHGLWRLLPDLAVFNQMAEAGYGGAISARLGGGLVLYALTMLALILLATIIVFERRNLE